ncbi:response regulator [Leptothoe sp. PORK10 BA2]|uniref:response regulator n=1 Tax=Leptothoe sp. PORK10 BA2 TaxID=3110254 RepID=UPI002B1F0D62|nr:response regulator [Leptothoe sp. PORK10 BA2]MEA5465942.1 response regulator [Leptothoe sp. PORK10 BA2]
MSTLSPLNMVSGLTQCKPRLLVVDDEPDNLALLYRTFRRDYEVLKAESGRKALDVLQHGGEVAVIISDQRMPEMTGTEFLSKTVPEFPDTIRIILTGFTDVEDLVQAINNGQVYRYITKPWEPDTLRSLVQQATQTYELLKQSNHALYVAERQAKLMDRVAQLATMELSLGDTLQFIVDGWGPTLSTSLCAIEMLGEEGGNTTAVFGDLQGQRLGDNPLVRRAIATWAMQALPNVASDHATSSGTALDGRPLDSLYAATATQAHLVIPVMYRGSLLAVVSFHWAQSYETLEDVGNILTTASAQLAQALVALRY